MFCALDSALEEALSEEKAWSKASNLYQFQVAIDVSVLKFVSRPA